MLHQPDHCNYDPTYPIQPTSYLPYLPCLPYPPYPPCSDDTTRIRLKLPYPTYPLPALQRPGGIRYFGASGNIENTGAFSNALVRSDVRCGRMCAVVCVQLQRLLPLHG